MATPYFQLRLDTVPSTQDVARDRFDGLPVLVIASAQTEGRGRSGAEWITADRALAVSIAFAHRADDSRPFSLMAGVAAIVATPANSLKWPNDVVFEGRKVGGILVERSGELTVVGLGLNLWWPDPQQGSGALFTDDPGEQAHVEIGALWGAELMQLLDDDDWPIETYRRVSDTIGKEVTWEPDGAGRAVDVAEDGALVVETGSGTESIYSGAVRHISTSAEARGPGISEPGPETSST